MEAMLKKMIIFVMLLTEGMKILSSNVQLNPKKEAVTFFDGFFIFTIMKEN